MLMSYPATVKKGHIVLPEAVTLPEGAEVLIVVALTEAMEDYALNLAMDEALDTPLLTREQALACLDTEL
jgi:hypothetical protein